MPEKLSNPFLASASFCVGAGDSSAFFSFGLSAGTVLAGFGAVLADFSCFFSVCTFLVGSSEQLTRIRSNRQDMSGLMVMTVLL
ncbi:hypothetical protein VU07_05675 [Desulfobulbus sp. F4]|nr:hypothetical protein [Desulfobulbus sp. F3]MCW5201262.1 hypothetical protein [Desulfobulbus sp. F4]